MNCIRFGRKSLWPSSGNILAFAWWDWGKPCRTSGYLVSCPRFELCTHRIQVWIIILHNTVGIKYEYVWGFYKEKNLMKLQYICARLNITSILLNAVVAVSKLNNMPCFVQTAFAEWVCTVTHHTKSNVFLLLTVLCDIACSCVTMQCMLFCSVIPQRNG